MSDLPAEIVMQTRVAPARIIRSTRYSETAFGRSVPSAMRVPTGSSSLEKASGWMRLPMPAAGTIPQVLMGGPLPPEPSPPRPSSPVPTPLPHRERREKDRKRIFDFVPPRPVREGVRGRERGPGGEGSGGGDPPESPPSPPPAAPPYAR